MSLCLFRVSGVESFGAFHGGLWESCLKLTVGVYLESSFSAVPVCGMMAFRSFA